MTVNEARYVWKHRNEYPPAMVQEAIAILEHVGEL